MNLRSGARSATARRADRIAAARRAGRIAAALCAVGCTLAGAACSAWTEDCSDAAIVRGLRDPDPLRRAAAARCAASRGTAARATVPALARALDDYAPVPPASTVNREVEGALYVTGAHPDAVAPLVDRLVRTARTLDDPSSRGTGSPADIAFGAHAITRELLERNFVPAGLGPRIAAELAPHLGEIDDPKFWSNRCLGESVRALARGEVFDLTGTPWNGPLCEYPPGTAPAIVPPSAGR